MRKRANLRDRDRPEVPGEEPVRVRLPRGRQVMGEIEQILGASRFRVSCKDGKTRLCRIPGKFRKRITVRTGDIVIVEPWEVEGDEKGDVVWIYNKTQMAWLRKRGYA
jgi:translation initiation factor 1A